ncbi:hypothetical protein F2Q69_00033392 [Brassica cretica]|uniref:Uncharacterized protein n=1 Tax=Brassica cretica TaxID=69181 RepID=A0A8S9SGG2_BRACR|nr:hypothetical protein F2Q69_00033392 [Brassica cretica]
MLTPPTRIKHDVSFNDTYPTPRRFSFPIKWLDTALPPSRRGCSDPGRPEGGYLKHLLGFRLNNDQMKNYGKRTSFIVKLRCLDHNIRSIKGSRDRNHTSNATGDISVTTRSEKRKRCSFNTYIISLLDMRAISDKLSFL